MLSVRVVGLEHAQARLAEVGRKVDPVLRGALNTTAAKARAVRFVKPMAKSIGGKRLRAALKVKRANTRRLESRIIPSSSGIPVLEYAAWGVEPIDKTRARVWVRGPQGQKVAAGFVNPAGRGQKPLSTRSSKTTAKGKTYAYQRAVGPALGPSAAYWFKQLSGTDSINWVNAFLQQEFSKRMRKELAR
jgi:hypothetical protein